MRQPSGSEESPLERHQQRLTGQQERNLVVAAECGDAEACRGLVEAFLPAIGHLARGFQHSSVERRELLQEGVAGLLLAARRYDAQLDTPFWAYASFWVRKAMQELVAEVTRPVALSDRAVRDLAHIRAARNAYLQRYGTEPITEQISTATGLTRTQVESLRVTDRMARSTDERLIEDDSASITLGDTIADPRAEQAYQEVLDELEIHHVLDLTNALEDRERAVIRSHYGLGEPPRTLRQIGAGLGLTAERARQIEAAALGKLRERLAQPATVSATPT
jgi:RNA polymerase primary sigma factor